MSKNHILILIILLIVGAYSVFNSFPPYDMILCAICGGVSGAIFGLNITKRLFRLFTGKYLNM